MKPFVKWVGGKRQLLPDIRKRYPTGLGESITKYAEPFVGGGAVLFDILSTYDIKEAYISDMNRELVNTYLVIRDECENLLNVLGNLESKHLSLDEVGREQFYYKNRDRYNELRTTYDDTNVEMAALFIYLNKTCFNGLYRVNSKGGFNASFGNYVRPTICDRENLIDVSKGLQKVEIVHGDYKESIDFIDENTFVYIDPPYRPLTKTASFNGWVVDSFDDEKQVELAQFAGLLSEKGAKVMISNSDPKNIDEDDDFFEKLYCDWNIYSVSANRMINTKKEGRGKVKEILVREREQADEEPYIRERT